MHLRERPFTQKVNIGDDPIANTIMGLDVKYETNAPWLTKALDKLPIYSTKEIIHFYLCRNGAPKTRSPQSY